VHLLTSRKITVAGTNWPTGTQVSITFIQLGVINTKVGNQNVEPNGSFSWQGNIPSAALPGSATIRVCSNSTCVSKTITVAAT